MTAPLVEADDTLDDIFFADMSTLDGLGGVGVGVAGSGVNGVVGTCVPEAVIRADGVCFVFVADEGFRVESKALDILTLVGSVASTSAEMFPVVLFSVPFTSDCNELDLHTDNIFGVRKSDLGVCVFAFTSEPFSAFLLMGPSLVKLLISVFGCKEGGSCLNRARGFKYFFEF